MVIHCVILQDLASIYYCVDVLKCNQVYIGKLVLSALQLNSSFCLYVKDALMHYPGTPST